jgi:large subunit ribosomal protein L23
MIILDKIRRTKKEEKKTAKPEKLKAEIVGKAEKKNEKKKESVAKKETSKKTKTSRENHNFAYSKILSVLITEKSTQLVQFNKYVFRVHQNANKRAVKAAVEGYYGVRVTKVNIVKIPAKARTQGRTLGYKKAYKKAIVTLVAGDIISTAEGA